MFLGFFFGLGALGVLGSRAIVPGRLELFAGRDFWFSWDFVHLYLPIHSK